MLPLLLLLFASFLQLPPPVSSAPVCSPKKCGNLTIDYPFWLEEAGRPPCGPRSFQLNCNGSRAFLTYSIFGLYQVARVFIQNSSFIVVDNNLPLHDGCPAPPFNIFLGLGLGPFVISRSNRELLFLHNCTKQQPSTPQGFLRTPCRNESSFFRHGEEYGGQHDHRGGLPPACNLSVVPVLGFPDGDDDYVASMKRGFLLEWTAASGDCPKCMASGGQCRYGSNGTGFSCNCSDGVHHEKCGDCPKCMASGGQCRYGSNGPGFSCNCSDGIHPEKCGDCPKCMASGGQCRYGSNGPGFSCNCSDGVHPEKCGELRKLTAHDEFGQSIPTSLNMQSKC